MEADLTAEELGVVEADLAAGEFAAAEACHSGRGLGATPG
jgi:hypothetical protein